MDEALPGLFPPPQNEVLPIYNQRDALSRRALCKVALIKAVEHPAHHVELLVHQVQGRIHIQRWSALTAALGVDAEGASVKLLARPR